MSAANTRRTLEAAGPAFIKWGQWAATRHDLFPPDMCTELEHLHTQVRCPEPLNHRHDDPTSSSCAVPFSAGHVRLAGALQSNQVVPA